MKGDRILNIMLYMGLLGNYFYFVLFPFNNHDYSSLFIFLLIVLFAVKSVFFESLPFLSILYILYIRVNHI